MFVVKEFSIAVEIPKVRRGSGLAEVKRLRGAGDRTVKTSVE